LNTNKIRKEEQRDKNEEGTALSREREACMRCVSELRADEFRVLGGGEGVRRGKNIEEIVAKTRSILSELL